MFFKDLDQGLYGWYILHVKKHESNLSTNTHTTLGKKYNAIEKQYNLLSEYSYQSIHMCFLPMVFIMLLSQHYVKMNFAVLVKNTHIAKVCFDFPLPNAKLFTLALKLM